MREPKLIWQLFPINILILMGAMLAIGWYGTHSLRTFHIRQMKANLEAQARLIEPQVGQMLAKENVAALVDYCSQASVRVSTRLTIIDLQGRVLCDSERDAAAMENHAERPEIMRAYRGEAGISLRYSATTKQDMLYVAVPVIQDKKTLGVLRTSVPLTAIYRELRQLFGRIALGILVVMLSAGFITLVVARKITRPLELMRSYSQRYARGDFAQKITVTGSEEIVSLARAMNKMAAQLDERMRAVLDKRNELETVLAGMVEGVVAVDPEDRVLYMNKAAMEQLDVEHPAIQGSGLLEVVRNLELLRFIQKTILQDRPGEKTIVFNQGRSDEKILQVHGAQLFDAKEKRIGALVVINDVTRLLRLENLRRDFVANVSHELKTPITSIKGYVETLLDETEEHPQHVRDFLEIISRQANRLQAIVEDLLALAKIEEESNRDAIILEPGRVKDVLQAAIEACSVKAADKGIEISLDCTDQVYAMINGPMLEQAVINLLDNALKYSKVESTVRIEAETGDKNVIIRVEDRGIGIARDHVDRLFERFYVVDKGRSRDSGGTGLGLAIVKHIVQAHGGRIEVKSQPGRGSTFSILLPKV